MASVDIIVRKMTVKKPIGKNCRGKGLAGKEPAVKRHSKEKFGWDKTQRGKSLGKISARKRLVTIFSILLIFYHREKLTL